jgi:hypothetical protein
MTEFKQPDDSRFEDVELPGIGNLKTFAALTVEDMRSKLNPSQYALYVTNDPVPENWPSEVLRYDVATMVSEGKQMDRGTWYVNRDGSSWERFYGVLYSDIEKPITKSAFIYERRHMTHGIAYIPVVALITALDGKITKASARWCASVLKRNVNP